MTGLQQLSPREAYAAYIMGSLLVDVREPADAADALVDVKKVVALPFSELDRRLNELPPDRRVVLLSQRGLTSAKAARLLMDQGFENVATLEGGLEAWAQEGLPLRKM